MHHRRSVRAKTVHHTAQAASVEPIENGTVFPDQGVTLSAASAHAGTYANSDGLATAASAAASFRALPAAQAAFGTALDDRTPTAEQFDVTETDPQSADVKVSVAYPAWVVSVSGPVIFTGIGSPPAAGTTCQDVGIYDLQASAWTELMQNC
jgi:hypothetical protein